MEELARAVVIAEQEAVVGVEADAARGIEGPGDGRGVRADVGVEDHADRFRRPVENLISEAGRRVEGSVSLPAVDQPELHLQAIGGEDLQPGAVEKPRRVVGGIGRLISPVLEVVVREQSDVRHEDSHVEIDATQDVPVISAVRFAQIAEGIAQVELPPVGAAVVARDAGCARSQLHEEPAARVVPVKIAAEAEEAQVELAGAESGGRADDGVIDRMVEVIDPVHVGGELTGEVLGIEQRGFLPVGAVEPGEIAKGERLGGGGRRGRSRGI